MENASKALIMAGGVLIALLIIGALLLMFNSLTSYQEVGVQNTKEAQVIEFNNQYVTYNRNDVRGSDLYSLLNNVIDYNRRKSSSGTGASDQGQYIAYEPMTISYTFNGKQDKLTFDGTNRIFTGEYANFTLDDKTSNKLDNQFKSKLTETYASKENMLSLASGISNLYDKTSDKDKLSAISLWNKYIKEEYKVTGSNNQEKVNKYNSEINNREDIKNAIYTYYEYTMFKRAYFKCTGTNYNNQTGRIIKMEFEFTGKFN